MKELTSQHLSRLKSVEERCFIGRVIDDMTALNITPSYPVDKSQKRAFVETVMQDGRKYDLYTEKECYVYIMAWHIIGKDILKIKWLMDILEDEEAFGEEKVEALRHATYEALGEKEVKQ